MIIIRTVDDLKKLDQNKSLFKAYKDPIIEHFLLLISAYGFEKTLGDSTLGGLVDVIVFEKGDNPRGLSLPMLPGNPSLFDTQPEYVEKLSLDGLEAYRIVFMLDNERMMFFYSEVGQFDSEIEEWLADQVEWFDYELDAK